MIHVSEMHVLSSSNWRPTQRSLVEERPELTSARVLWVSLFTCNISILLSCWIFRNVDNKRSCIDLPHIEWLREFENHQICTGKPFCVGCNAKSQTNTWSSMTKPTLFHTTQTLLCFFSYLGSNATWFSHIQTCPYSFPLYMIFFGTDKNHSHAAFGELMPHTSYKESVCDANKFAKCVGGAGIIGKYITSPYWFSRWLLASSCHRFSHPEPGRLRPRRPIWSEFWRRLRWNISFPG